MTINSSAVSKHYCDVGGRGPIKECSEIEALMRYASLDGVDVGGTTDSTRGHCEKVIKMRDEPYSAPQYWLCRHKKVPFDAAMLIREYHHAGLPKTNYQCLQEVIIRSCQEESSYDSWRKKEERLERFVKASFRKAFSSSASSELRQKGLTLYFPTFDSTVDNRRRGRDDEFVPGQHVHLIQSNSLLSGTIKEAFTAHGSPGPTQYSVVCRGDTFLVEAGQIVCHRDFVQAMPSAKESTSSIYDWADSEKEWMRALKAVFVKLGATTSHVDIFACFHGCYYFNMNYDRLSWVRRATEDESSYGLVDGLKMVPDEELVIHSYSKKQKEHFKRHWEPFQIQEWSKMDRNGGDGKYAVIPQMKEQRQKLFKGCALKVVIGNDFIQRFIPTAEAEPAVANNDTNKEGDEKIEN